MSVSENTTNNDPPQLKLLLGGKGTTNWVWFLPLGTVFLAQEAGSTKFVLSMFQLVEKSSGCVCLMVPEGQRIWVDPFKFSAAMINKEILALGDESVSPDDADD